MKRLLIWIIVVSVCLSSVFATTTDSVNSVAQTDIDHYWNMNDAGITDDVGSATMTVSGATSGSVGIINDAYDFDGSNDYVYADDADIHGILGGDMTWSWWVNVDTLQDSTIMGKWQDGSGSDTGVAVNIDSAGSVLYFSDRVSSGTPTYDTGYDLTSGQWYHIVLVKDVDDDAYRFYFNGELEHTGDGGEGAAQNLTNANDLVLGNDARDKSGSPFDGRIDEVGVWDRVLDGDQVSDIYNNGIGDTYPMSDVINISITNPTDGAVNITDTQNVSFVVGGVREPTSCFYYNTTTPTTTQSINCTQDLSVNWNIGQQNITINATEGSYEVSADVGFIVGSSSVDVTIDHPLNNVTYQEEEQDINYTFSGGMSPHTCEYRVNEGAWQEITSCENTSATFPQGNVDLDVRVNDSDGNSDTDSIFFTIAQDITITWITPSEDDQTFSSSPTLQYDVSDSNVLDYCRYRINGVLVGNTSCGEDIDTNLADSDHNATIEAVDDFGEVTSSTRTFTVGGAAVGGGGELEFDGLTTGECEETRTGVMFLFFLVALGVVMIIIAPSFGALWALFGGLLIFFTALFIYPCAALMGGFVGAVGLLGVLTSVMMPMTPRRR